MIEFVAIEGDSEGNKQIESTDDKARKSGKVAVVVIAMEEYGLNQHEHIDEDGCNR